MHSIDHRTLKVKFCTAFQVEIWVSLKIAVSALLSSSGKCDVKKGARQTFKDASLQWDARNLGGAAALYRPGDAGHGSSRLGRTELTRYNAGTFRIEMSHFLRGQNPLKHLNNSSNQSIPFI